VGPRAGLDRWGKSRPPTGIRSPDRPARSQSVYRLSYLLARGTRTYTKLISIGQFVSSLTSLNNSDHILYRKANFTLFRKGKIPCVVSSMARSAAHIVCVVCHSKHIGIGNSCFQDGS